MVEPGQNLLHYRLVEKLGEGGMGVVWKAVDTKLDRDVAIKILPEHFSADPDRLGRFEREAKLLASLNHRNIASLYGLEEVSSPTDSGQASLRFLVMEYVDGEDLAQRLARGPLPVHEALDVAHQLSRALDSAHEKGVLHRDLKPANVQISSEGRVKVLDFGLAKAFDSGPDVEGNPTMSPTLTSAGTAVGVILGTAAYMSPEQARGKTLDKRTDIWSFACVLYESLTGRSPFRGETITDTLASVVKTQADWSALPAETPPRIRELLQRCLEKDARNRLRDIGDARLELQRAHSGEESLVDSGVMAAEAAPTIERPRRGVAMWLAVGALVGALGGIALWNAWTGSGTKGPASNGPLRLSIAFPPEFLVDSWLLSPDSRRVVYRALPRETPGGDSAVWNLYLRDFDSFEPRRVEGSAGVVSYAFSPDGRWLAIQAPVAPRATKQRLWKIPVDGNGPPMALIDWSDDWSGTFLWLPDGDLIVPTVGSRSLVRVPSGGGTPREPLEIQVEGLAATFNFYSNDTTVLPDGVHVLGRVVEYSERGYETHVGLIDLDTGVVRVIVENGNRGQWSPTGHVVFSRGDAVLAVPFDLGEMNTTGDTVAIQAGFRALAGWDHTAFDLSAGGTLVHWPGGIFGDKRQIVIYDYVDGELAVVEPWSDELRQFEGDIEASVDGRRLAVGIANDGGIYDIWTSDMGEPRLSRFAAESGRDCLASYWTRDGESLAYKCESTEEVSIYLARVDGTEEPRALITTRTPESYRPHEFFPDDSKMVLDHTDGETTHLALLSLDGGSGTPPAPERWLDDACCSAISPDGRWLAYNSDTSGRWELYLRPIRSDGSLGREVPVTTQGGSDAWWYPDSSPMRLRYRDRNKRYVVNVTTEPGLKLSRPELIGENKDLLEKFVFWDTLPDGRFIGVLKGEEEATPNRLNVVVNWTREMQRRMRAQP